MGTCHFLLIAQIVKVNSMIALCIFTVDYSPVGLFISSVKWPQAFHLKKSASLTGGEMICAEQSTMNETDLDSAIFYSNISLPSENCYEIHKQDNFSSDGCLTFIYKENAEFFFSFILFIYLFFLARLFEQNPENKSQTKAGIQYLL